MRGLCVRASKQRSLAPGRLYAPTDATITAPTDAIITATAAAAVPQRDRGTGTGTGTGVTGVRVLYLRGYCRYWCRAAGAATSALAMVALLQRAHPSL